MEYYKKIVGDRIYLSPVAYTEEALDKFTGWMNDFNVTDYTGRSSEITTYLNEKEWFHVFVPVEVYCHFYHSEYLQEKYHYHQQLFCLGHHLFLQ